LFRRAPFWVDSGGRDALRCQPFRRTVVPNFFAEEVISLAYTITEECINCGACEPVCPVNAISEQGDARVIDAGTCIDCAACVDTCPVDAIKAP